MATDLEEKETSSIPKIRTFAADLKAVRKARGEDVDDTPDPEAPEPIPKKKTQEVPDPIPKKEPEKEEKQPDPIPKKEGDRPEPKIIEPKRRRVESNPPFHEMQQQKRPKIDLAEEDLKAAESDSRESLLADKGKTVTIGKKGRSGIGGGTVVTDTKRKRFRFFPSVFRSIADWFEDFKNKYISKKPPKYTVSGAYRKRGVISDGTVSSGITNVDHKRAVERIKKRRDEDEEEDTEETDEASSKQARPLLLEAPDEDGEGESADKTPSQTSNVATEERKTVATKRQKELEAKEAELKRREEALQAAEAEAQRLREQAQSEAKKSREEAAEEIERLRAEAAAAVEEAESRREAAAAEVTDAQMRAAAAAVLAQQGAAEEGGGAAAPEQRSLREQLRDTNVASLLAVVGIAGIVILYVAFESLYSLIVPPPVITPTVDVPMVISGEQIQITAPAEGLAGTIRNTIDEAGSDVVQVDVLVGTSDGVALASPELLAERLGWQADTAFIGSLRQISLGGYDRIYPFIVLKSTDYETALGGMLSWESTLPQDVALFTGTSGSEEATPEAGQSFADVTIAGVDVRESTAAVDNQMVWGFVDDTTILITPNRFVFTEVLPFVE